MQFLRKIKEAVAENAARRFINNKYAAFGIMTKLEIDSKAKTIRAELDLEGELAPIILHISRYEVVRDNGKTYLKVAEAEVSRGWLDLLAKQHVVGQRWEVPELLQAVL